MDMHIIQFEAKESNINRKMQVDYFNECVTDKLERRHPATTEKLQLKHRMIIGLK